MATVGYAFTPVSYGGSSGAGSGAGGSTYSSISAAIGSTAYFNITNNSSVAANPTVTVSASFSVVLSLWPTMGLYTCSVPWNTTFGTCSGTQTTAGTYDASTSPAYAWGQMAPTSTQYVKATMGGALGSVSFAAVVNSSALPAGTDRTAG